MNIEELERLIANDENVHLELKKTTGELKDGMHTACAFLNGAGGWLVFGVAPKSLKILGQEVTDNTQREIAQALSGLEPAVSIDIQYIDVPDRLGCQVIAMYFEAFFLSGFESFDLYKTIIDSFMYTGKYLWIYGRKNMKLFGGSFNSFFKYLEEKSSFDNMLGIDFRCLFLDPDSPEVERAHIQQDIFKSELTSTILRAKAIVKDNAQLQKCFRLYSNRREEIIIRLDNCIIYARPGFDANGFPRLLTNSGFEVFSSRSKKGKECIKKFENIWQNAKTMF